MKRLLFSIALIGCTIAGSASAQVLLYTNDTTTPTQVNKLVAVTTSNPQTVRITTNSDGVGTNRVQMGVVVAGAGIAPTQAVIASSGQVSCIADAGGMVSGHYVINSNTGAPACKDGGATPPADQIVGTAVQNAVAGAAFVMTVVPFTGR